MAYLRYGSPQTYIKSAATVTHVLSDSIAGVNEIDDILILNIGADGARTVTVPTGWTAVRNNTAQGVTHGVFWRRATAQNEDVPDIVLSAADELTAEYFAIQGCPTGSTPIGNTATNDGDSITPSWLTITPTAHSVILYLGTQDTDTIYGATGKALLARSDAVRVSTSSNYEYTPDTTATGTVNGTASAGDGWQTLTLEILDDGTPNIPIYFSSPPFQNISADLPASTSSNTWRDLLSDSGEDFFTGTSFTEHSFDASTDVTIGSTNIDSGSNLATVLDSNIVTDSTKAWTVDAYKNHTITISSGADAGTYTILENTATTLTLSSNMTATAGSLSYTVDYSDSITLTAHGMTNGTVVRADANGNSLPTGITDGNYYFVAVLDANTVNLRDANTVMASNSDYFQDVLTPKATVDITVVGSGTCKFQENKLLMMSTNANGVFDRPPSSAHTGLQWEITGFTFSTARDMTGEIFGVPLDPFNVGQAAVIFMDSSGNYKTWQVSGNGIYIRDELYQFDLADTNTANTYGSFDVTDVKHVMLALMRNAENNRTAGTQFYILDASIVIAAPPLGIGGWDDLYNALQLWSTVTSDKPSDTQFTFLQSIKFGEGHLVGDRTIDFTDGAKSIGFPKSADGVTSFQNYLTTLGISFDINAASSVVFPNCLISAAAPLAITVDADRPAGATINIDGALLVNPNVTFQSDDTLDGVSFIEGLRPTFNGATVTNCTFKNIDDADGYILYTTSDNITDATFQADVAADYAIEIDTAGDYTLDGFTFTGFTKDINITETTGTVNINIIGGGDIPTYDTAGATVNITQNVNITAANLIDDTRVQLYNVTKDAELDNSVVSGGSGYTYSADLAGADVDDGDTIRLRATYQSGVTAKKELTNTGIVTSTGLAFLDTQEDDSVYNSYGVDGSTITEFVWDNPNLEVDIDDPDNVSVAQRLGCWKTYYGTTEDGIRNLFGGITWETLNSIRINTTIVNLKLENVDTVNPLSITDGRIYRDDGANVIASGSGSIHLDYDPVHVAKLTDLEADVTQLRKDVKNLQAITISKIKI